jgi:hypothetical protein
MKLEVSSLRGGLSIGMTLRGRRYAFAWCERDNVSEFTAEAVSRVKQDLEHAGLRFGDKFTQDPEGDAAWAISILNSLLRDIVFGYTQIKYLEDAKGKKQEKPKPEVKTQ